MPITKPQLPPIRGYVEVEINGERKYKNTDTGVILEPDRNLSPTPLTHEQINAMVVSKIRERYDVDREFKMINLGIADPANEEYITYRDYVQKCVDWGNHLETSEGGDL